MKRSTGIGMLIVAGVIMFLMAPQARAQATDTTATLRGIVTWTGYSEEGDFNLPGASVMLISGDGERKDTLYRVCGSGGGFQFKDLKPGKVTVRITHVGFREFRQNYDIGAGENLIVATLALEKETLNSAVITSRVPLVRQKGDTTVFNAAAVSRPEGESAVAVLEQLPGFEIAGDCLTYQGVRIDRTYVNGVQIFGDRPLSAFEHLDAEEVTQVSVYDEDNAEDIHHGLKHARRERVVDVTTRDKFLSITSCVADLGVGMDGSRDMDGKLQALYNLTAGAEFNSEMKNAEAVFCMDNVGKNQLPGLESMRTLIDRRYRPVRTSDMKQSTAELSFSKYWKNRRYGDSVTGTYWIQRTEEKSARRALTEYCGAGSVPDRLYADTTFSSTSRLNHNFEVTGSFVDTPLKDISASVSGSYTDGRSFMRESVLNSISGSPSPMLRNPVSGMDDGDFSLKTSVRWTDNERPLWRPSVKLNGKFSDRNTLSWDTDTLSSSSVRRDLQSEAYGKSWSLGVDAGVTGTLRNDSAGTALLKFNVYAGSESSHKRRMTVDLWGADVPIVDLADSYEFTWNTFSAGSIQTFEKRRGNLTAILKLDERADRVDDTEVFPESNSSGRKYFSILPSVNILRMGDYMLSVNTQALLPSAEQTRGQLSDVNPLILTSGNPSLKKSYKIGFSASKTLYSKMSSGMTFITAGIGGNTVLHPIVTNTIHFSEDTALPAYGGYVAPAGSMLNTFSNASPSWSAQVSLSHSASPEKTRIKTSTKLAGSLEKAPQYIMSSPAVLTTRSLSLSNQENIQLGKSGRIGFFLDAGFLDSESDIGGLVSRRLVTSVVITGNKSLPHHFSVASSVNMSGYIYFSGYGADSFFSPFRVSVEKRFPANNLTVRLNCMDIFDNASPYTTAVTSESFSQVWSSSYGRYFILDIIYRLERRK